MGQKKAEHVVLIHGLFMRPVVMKPLQFRLERAGYSASCFGYRTTRESLENNIDALHRFVSTLDAETVHFVGHSLGGLLIRYLFERYPSEKPGCIVSLGTPHQGAEIAHFLSNTFLAPILGASKEKGLLEPPGPWIDKSHPYGSIAGTAPTGPLPLLTNNRAASDGTVLLSETFLEGQTDHISLPCLHTQLIYSESAYEQVIHFLATQRFNHSNS